MQQLNLPASIDSYNALRAAYAEPHRHYHNTAHLIDCLTQLQQASTAGVAWSEVALALWFHDAIYQPQAKNNEAESAAWATRFLLAQGESFRPLSERVCQHILATCHQTLPQTAEAALVVDIDLSILGRTPTVFSQFETNIRQEYQWVPDSVYVEQRCQVLTQFLNRPTIFLTQPFQRRYEKVARENLQATIKRLRWARR